MPKSRTIVVAVLITVLFILVVQFVQKNQASMLAASTLATAPTVAVGGAVLTVEVADESAERILGLSGRSGLPRGAGLFFVFDYADTYGIWMKDMRFPIDIIWLDDDLRVVGLERHVVPETYPMVFKPEAPARYVLETNAGFADMYGIELGDTAEVSEGVFGK